MSEYYVCVACIRLCFDTGLVCYLLYGYIHAYSYTVRHHGRGAREAPRPQCAPCPSISPPRLPPSPFSPRKFPEGFSSYLSVVQIQHTSSPAFGRSTRLVNDQRSCIMYIAPPLHITCMLYPPYEYNTTVNYISMDLIHSPCRLANCLKQDLQCTHSPPGRI